MVMIYFVVPDSGNREGSDARFWDRTFLSDDEMIVYGEEWKCYSTGEDGKHGYDI